jgi:hypothetical protein
LLHDGAIEIPLNVMSRVHTATAVETHSILGKRTDLVESAPCQWPSPRNEKADRTCSSSHASGGGCCTDGAMDTSFPDTVATARHQSFRATSGPVIRFSSGNVEAMIASDATSPARTVAQ